MVGREIKCQCEGTRQSRCVAGVYTIYPIHATDTWATSNCGHVFGGLPVWAVSGGHVRRHGGGGLVRGKGNICGHSTGGRGRHITQYVARAGLGRRARGPPVTWRSLGQWLGYFISPRVGYWGEPDQRPARYFLARAGHVVGPEQKGPDLRLARATRGGSGLGRRSSGRGWACRLLLC